MEETLWNDFKRIGFEFEGRKAILVFPKEANENCNWLLKTEYFSAFQSFELEMVKRGWHLAFIENKTRWCTTDEDLDLKRRFADFLRIKYGLYSKCLPVGMSCGGMIAVKFAAKYPMYVSALYLDAPVMNLLSCPAGLGISGDEFTDEFMEEFVSATGMSMSELICYREHPMDKMHVLLENNIPVILVYGESDDVVPYIENGKLLENYYKQNDGTIITIGKKDCGHHPHGLEDNTPIIEFAKKYSI